MPSLPPDFLRAREADLQAWFSAHLPPLGRGVQQGPLVPVSGDASFRRYFRAHLDGGTCILVDAPPPHENCAPFVDVDQRLAARGVNVPTLLAWDTGQGFMCLQDLGDTLYWSSLDAARRDPSVRPQAGELYHRAFDQLLGIQTADASGLPVYDDALLRREMQLFVDWFCQGLLRLESDASAADLIAHVFDVLVDNALAQPRVFVHRDYHSRNLMYIEGQAPGVIDFQDAVLGPATYDLVSLLRDCYIEWPAAQVQAWALDWHGLAHARQLPLQENTRAFLRDFDFMGMQRHLKVLGIFARLWLRDGKRGYLADLPLTLRYLHSVAAQYPEFASFTRWIEVDVVPRLTGVLAELEVEPRT